MISQDREEGPPEVSFELIEWLERKHPLKPPSIRASNRAIWVEVGRQDVISDLRNLYRRQREEEEASATLSIR